MEENEMGITPMDPSRFFIDSDERAEWALERIREAREDHDRLMALADAKQAELDDRKAVIGEKYKQETEWLMYQLQAYMTTVKCKSTKTRDTYQLLSGKLIRKKPAVEYKVDSEALTAWLKATGRGDFVQTTEKPRWGEVKKLLIGDADSGAVAVAETGEIVEGVTAALGEAGFDVTFS